jgi:anti-sigma-K factor RskA
VNDHDQHLLTGAYAADSLDREEREAFRLHLDTCAACRQEVAELSETAARLAEAAAEPAPAGLRERVLAEAARTRQLSPVVSRLGSRRAARSWYRAPTAAAAAVLLVVAAGLGGLAVVEHRHADEARLEAARIASIAADPDRVERTVAFTGGGGTGTVVSAHGLAFFHGRDLPRLPDGRAYQLWRIRGQESTSAGVLGRGGELTGVVTDIGPDDAVGVTVEPASGSDQPSTDPVFLVTTA